VKKIWELIYKLTIAKKNTAVRIIDETIEEDHLNREFGDIIQTWDENGKAR
jgi:hypothetical protein